MFIIEVEALMLRPEQSFFYGFSICYINVLVSPERPTGMD